VTAEAGRFWREGGHLVTEQDPVVPGIDVTRPSVARVPAAATHAKFWNHDAAAVTSWLAGLEIVPPGVREAGRRVAGIGGVPTGRPAYPPAAAAVKTGA
jgi:hypothetical protein